MTAFETALVLLKMPLIDGSYAEQFNDYGEVNYPEEADIDYEIDMDEGDVCCEDARMQFREALRKHFGRASWDDLDTILEGSCDELQEQLEHWISLKRVFSYKDKDKDGITLHEDLMRIQNNWDTCSSTTQGEDMGFYASADPFEAAWDIMQKQIGIEGIANLRERG